MPTTLRTPDQLGALLRSRRRALGLTQKSAGAKVGLKQATVSMIEADASRTSVASLYKLLSALELELSLSPLETRADPASGGDW